MKEQCISFETYQLALKAGFPFDEKGSHQPQSIIQKWLRELPKEKNIVCLVDTEEFTENCTTWSCTIYSNLIKEEYEDDNVFDSYEKALEEGLKDSLKLLIEYYNDGGSK